MADADSLSTPSTRRLLDGVYFHAGLAKEKARQEALNAPDRPENKGLTEAYLRVRQLGATTDEVTPGSKLTSGATSGSFTSSPWTARRPRLLEQPPTTN